MRQASTWSEGFSFVIRHRHVGEVSRIRHGLRCSLTLQDVQQCSTSALNAPRTRSSVSADAAFVTNSGAPSAGAYIAVASAARGSTIGHGNAKHRSCSTRRRRRWWAVGSRLSPSTVDRNPLSRKATVAHVLVLGGKYGAGERARHCRRRGVVVAAVSNVTGSLCVAVAIR